MEKNIQNVTMTDTELEEFRAFKMAAEKKRAAEKAKEERDAYKSLVNETLEEVFPSLQEVSASLSTLKTKVFEAFQDAIKLKQQIYNINDEQASHTFTNSERNKRVTIGYYMLDSYGDTVNEGVAMVKEYLSSLARDEESASLVNAILRLLSKDQTGNLKASRVLQLRKMAEESGNDRFKEGVKIIEESYQPSRSKSFVRAEIMNDKGAWENIHLGMTES